MVSLGTAGKVAVDRRGGNPGVINFLQGSVPYSTSFRIIIVGTVIRYGKDSGMDAYMVPAIYHKKSGTTEPGKDVGDAGGWGSHIGSRYAISGHVHWPKEGGCIPVGGVAPSFEVYTSERGYGGGTMVASGGP